MLTLKDSFKLYDRYHKLVPGASTASKCATRFPFGAYPIFLESGDGITVQDVDGNGYMDFINGLGPIILGYNNREINKAIENQLKKGILFSLPTKLEIEVAEQIQKMIPCAESVKFTKEGSSADAAAFRLARAYTRRNKIAYCTSSYHGWSDTFASSQPIHNGVPDALSEMMIPFNYNDIKSLHTAFESNKNEIGLVILEPVVLEEPYDNFLSETKKIAHKNGAILAFDEIVSGFRWGPGGAQEYYNVTPDIAMIGKSMGNGMPINALVGREDIMSLFDMTHSKTPVFLSGTFMGETLSLAAALKTMSIIEEEKTTDHIWTIGKHLKTRFNKLSKEADVKIKLDGLGPRMVFTYPDVQTKSIFLQETAKRGILFGNIVYPTIHTMEDIDWVLEQCENILQNIGNVELEGEICQDLDLRKKQ